MAIDVPPDCSAYTARMADFPSEASQMPSFMERIDARLVCERLAAAQWSPIAIAAADGREVRRVAFQDARARWVVPVMLERAANGEITVRLTTGSGSTLEGAVPEAAWAALVKRDHATKPLAQTRRGAKAAPVSLRCPDLKLEAADGGAAWSRSAFGCDMKDGFAAYAYEIANIAATYIPRCTAMKGGPNPFETDDPASRAFAPLALCAGAVATPTP